MSGLTAERLILLEKITQTIDYCVYPIALRTRLTALDIRYIFIDKILTFTKLIFFFLILLFL